MTGVVLPSRSRPSPRLLRFSLRALLCLMLMLAMPLAWIANWRAGRIREHIAERKLLEIGGDTKVGDRDLPNYYGGNQPSWLDCLLPKDCQRPVVYYSSDRFDFESRRTIVTPVNDEIISLLIQLPNLRVLRLVSKEHSGVELARLRGLPQLNQLELLCDANDGDVAAFVNQRHLKYLYLWNQPITDQSLRLAAQNPELLSLDLNDTNISDEGLRQLSSLRRLECLSIPGARVTAAGIKHLAGLPKLEILDLERTLVDDSALPDLAKLPLRSVNVNETRFSPKGREKLYRTVEANYTERMRLASGY